MTPEQVIKVIKLYEEKIDSLQNDGNPIFLEEINYLKTMFPKMRDFVNNAIWGGSDAQKNWDKVNRWLGFVQGVLWTNDVYTIDEMREHNRSNE